MSCCGLSLIRTKKFWQVFKLNKKLPERSDHFFLESVFEYKTNFKRGCGRIYWRESNETSNEMKRQILKVPLWRFHNTRQRGTNGKMKVNSARLWPSMHCPEFTKLTLTNGSRTVTINHRKQTTQIIQRQHKINNYKKTNIWFFNSRRYWRRSD
jgi:hypothetical protein